MSTEVAAKADFSIIRYAQCWEDADVLVEALDIEPESVCLSIASAGDNALALLSRGPRRVVALDMNPAQLACLELRVAAYRNLEHSELLELIGSVESDRRRELYQRCRAALPEDAARFWDHHRDIIDDGIGAGGKFENYFAQFRRYVLPLVHRSACARQMLAGGPEPKRRAFYQQQWNTWRWRLMFRVFFSRFMAGRLGRDPSFFEYVTDDLPTHLLKRVAHVLTELDPAENPYLQWIFTGRHLTALPLALRPECFDAIRNNLDRLEIRQDSVEDFLDAAAEPVDRFNLSDIFEYMSEDNYERLLRRLAAASRPGGRLAYWNMLVPRTRPDSLAGQLRPLSTLAERLYQQDKAFFYSRFVVEEVLDAGVAR